MKTISINNIKYEDLQRTAIATAANKGLLILTGGPGTGKTTAIKGIINKSLKAAGGSKLSFLLVHWTCDVDPAIPNQAWCIDLSIGGLRTVNKSLVAAWRAVCEF